MSNSMFKARQLSASLSLISQFLGCFYQLCAVSLEMAAFNFKQFITSQQFGYIKYVTGLAPLMKLQHLLNLKQLREG